MTPKPRPALKLAPSRAHPLTRVPNGPEERAPAAARTPTAQDTVMLSVRATRELREQARIHAVREGISLQLLVEQALTSYLATHAR
jgi:hypothetical protein